MTRKEVGRLSCITSAGMGLARRRKGKRLRNCRSQGFALSRSARTHHRTPYCGNRRTRLLNAHRVRPQDPLTKEAPILLTGEPFDDETFALASGRELPAQDFGPPLKTGPGQAAQGKRDGEPRAQEAG